MTTLNLADLSVFGRQIAALREAGATDVALSEGSASHVRDSRGRTTIESPSHCDIDVFCRAIFGVEAVDRLRLGGEADGVWNGCKVAAVVARKHGPYYVVLRLNG